MYEQEVKEIELSIDAAKEMVARGRDAEKLADNPIFKRLVLNGYFKDEAARLALLVSDPQISEEQRQYVERDLYAVGGFRRYLSTLVQMGQMAEREIEEAQETLEELREEEFTSVGE